jgi:hypothetical protein
MVIKMTTAQDVFDKAMAIMDEIDESGGTVNDDTLEYRNRALFIINTLQGEIYRYSDTYTATAGVRSVCPETEELDDALGVDDFLARSVLPYGLAAHFLATDGESALASFCLARYQMLLAQHGSAIPEVSEDIEDVYGGIISGSDDE